MENDSKQDGSLVTKSLQNVKNMIRKQAVDLVGRASITGGNKRGATNHEQIEIEFSESGPFDQSMGMDNNPLDDDSN